MDNNTNKTPQENLNELTEKSIVISLNAKETVINNDHPEEDAVENDWPVELSEDYDAEVEKNERCCDTAIRHLSEKWNNLSTVKKVGFLSCSTVFILLIAIVVTVSAVFLHYYHLMVIEYNTDIIIDDNVTFSDTELSEIPDGEVKIGKNDVFRDKSVLNILLIGTDERSRIFSTNARADSIMIMSLDDNNKIIRLVSLERGMLVSIPGRKNDILTHTFRYGGANLLMKTVRTHLNADVDKYVRVNFEMFQKLVDEVGGIDIVLTKQEADGLNKWPNNNTGKMDRKIHEGMNHFNGYEALQYSRLRWIDSDFQRIERQRKVIVAIKENMKDLSVSDLKDVSEDCLPYIQTNLSAWEIAGILMNLPGYLENDIDQMTIPQKGTYKTLGHVDYKRNAEILNQFLYR